MPNTRSAKVNNNNSKMSQRKCRIVSLLSLKFVLKTNIPQPKFGWGMFKSSRINLLSYNLNLLQAQKDFIMANSLTILARNIQLKFILTTTEILDIKRMGSVAIYWHIKTAATFGRTI